MTASPIRHDFDIYNEACAFSVTCQSAIEQIIQSDDDMKGLFQRRLVIAQELVEDDVFSTRVVVGDELMSDEEGWLGRVTGILHIPCGKLLVCAGFDLDTLYDFNRMGQNEYVHPVDVPPGTYRVDIYTYVNSINGGFCLPDTVKLGAWFRRSYPDTPFPLWLAAICEQDPSQDPEHEAIWADMEQAVEDGQLTLDPDPTALIDVVIQLRPLSNDIQLSSLDDTEDGFFAPHTGARLPDQFPLGVRSSTLPSNDYEMGLLFGDTWNVEEAQIQDEASKAEFDAMLADIEQAMATPYDNDLIFAGQQSRYFRAAINNVPHYGRSQTLSTLFQVWHPHHATSDDLMSGIPSIESIDVMMHAMGFDLLGDLRCEHINDVVMRGYVCTDSQTFALLMVGTSGQHGLDFYSRFDDNTSQTTTSIAGMDDHAHAGIFRTSYPDTDYQTLYTLHLQYIEQKSTQGVQAQAITPTLEALAACIDELLQRQAL